MHTRFLYTLVRIARVGSFSKVAEELNTTLSTVSMQMKALEQDLGVELFDRSHRPPMLTPLGRRVTQHARSLLNAEKQIKETCGSADQLTGSFRMGFVATASVRLLPGFLKNAAIHAPEAEFLVETALSENLEQRVRAGQLDAAVVTDTGDDLSGLSLCHLREEAMQFALPNLHEGKTVGELFADIPFLQFNPRSGIGRLIERKIQPYAPNRAKRMIVLDSVEAIMACVNNGLGFTLLAEPDILRYATMGTVLKTPEGDPFVRRLTLVSASNQANADHVELLANLFE